jgi:hypothetical protein
MISPLEGGGHPSSIEHILRRRYLRFHICLTIDRVAASLSWSMNHDDIKSPEEVVKMS